MPKIHQKPVDKSELKLFKLVNGQHIGPDYSVEPEAVTDTQGNVTGYTYPSKLYDANTGDCYVLSPTDLVKKLVNKFQAEPNWGDAHKRLMRGEQPRPPARPPMQQHRRADDMDREDAAVSPHNPPLDQPDIADKSRLPENQTKEGKRAKQETAEAPVEGGERDVATRETTRESSKREASSRETAGRETTGTETTRQGTEKDVGGHKTDTVHKSTHTSKKSH